MIDEKLLRILGCPETRQTLRLAAEEAVTELNARIAAGRLSSRSGETVRDAIDAGLIREDGKVLYPVRKGVPVLLVSAGIGMTDDEPAAIAQREAGEEAIHGD